MTFLSTLLKGILFLLVFQSGFAAEYFSGRVWYDLNKNGLEDPGEPGVAGAVATVRGTAITTDANGYWQSVDLRSNRSYSVTFSNIPAGYVFTLQDQGSDDTIDSDANPVDGSTVNYTAVRNSTISDIDAGIFLPEPEIDVKGNGLSILDGDVSPSLSDDTYFGSADIVSGSVVHTFTIWNTGDGALDLTGIPTVSISGTHAGDFSLTNMPSTPVAANGGSASFTVTFDPQSSGSRLATLSIQNNDADEGSYTFAIQGTGTATPEIDVTGAGVSIPDGDTSPGLADQTDFGVADIYGGAVTHSFLILNSGSGDLTLTGSPRIQVTGTHAADFTVSEQPAFATVAAQGGTQTFKVTFDPMNTGLRQATLYITSNDANESPYTFAIQGTGTLNPEIDIFGNGLEISSGSTTPIFADSTNFGVSQIGASPHIITYEIVNNGQATLLLTGSWPLVQIGGTHASDFSVYSAPSSSIPVGGSSSFQISFEPITAGTRSAILTIPSNDLNESSYTFAIKGFGEYETPPLSEIEVRGNFYLIPHNDSSPSAADGTDFGSVLVDGASASQTFTVSNVGTEDLVLTASPLASIAGAHAADFSVVQQPSSPVAPNGTVPFIVTFNPSAGGMRSAYLSIENNDADESPYIFTIQGTGLTSPEISVRGNGLEISSGDNTPSMTDSTYFGSVTASLGVNYVTYTIHNTGSTTLNLTGTPLVAITGDAASEYTVTSQPSAAIPANGSSSFVVSFDPSQVGYRNAAISIASNDADESSYLFAIQGNGTGPGSPLACVPNFFHIYGDNGTITYLDATTNPYTYTEILTAGYSINGMGYNLEDGLLYGFEMDAVVPGNRIVRIDGEGTLTVLNSVTIPYESWRADFDDSGNMYFWNSTGDNISIFDASEGTVTSRNTGGVNWVPIDMAYLDFDGRFYGVQTTTLYIYDPITNNVSTSNITGRLADEYNTGTNSSYYGAAWTAYDGYLYTTNSQSGRMYKINVGTGESVYVGQAEANLNKSDGASCPLAEAPLPSTGSIGNQVWLDSDMDGIQDASETGLPGVTVSLYSSDDTFIASTTTDASGTYSFQNLPPSDYYLIFSNPPSGFSITLQDQGSNNLLDSDADEITGRTDDFFVSVSLIEEGLDAGYTTTGLGNFVWNDLDADGIQDLGEPGVPGVVAELLLASNNTLVTSTTTDANGYYYFTNISPNNYRVRFNNLPGGFVVSPQNSGFDDAADSDISTSTRISDAVSISSGQFNSTVDAGINQNTSPEMNVTGNSTNIVDGDATPSVTDHTDFGSILASSGSLVRTFTIENTLTGSAALTLNGSPVVAISGAHASDFSLSVPPASTSLTPGSSTSFQITFDPSNAGVRSAVVTISNNDDNENPYDFSIQGTGLAPEMGISGDDNAIASGDTLPQLRDGTDFGSADIVSGTPNATFRISNSGSSPLNLTGSSPYVIISGDHAADFSVITPPSNSIAVNAVSDFVLQFNPSAIGLRTAQISIANNDLDENPYTFSIQGTGTSFPEIEVTGMAIIIADGDGTTDTADDTDFGSQDIIADQVTHTFTIHNNGSGPLVLTELPMVQVTGVNAGDFVVTQQPASATIPSSGSATFQVTFDPTTTGFRYASLVIPNDDTDENPYNFAISGLGTSTIDEEIEILGNNILIESGDMTPSASDFTDLGTGQISGVPSAREFVIKNIGYAVLNLTGPPPYVDIAGVNPGEFSITQSPSNSIGIDGASTTFEVTFTPAALGPRSAIISIQNDDADENPYTFMVTGTGVYDPSSQSEILIQGNMLSILDGDAVPSLADGTDFGDVEVVGGYSVSHNFVIQNLGSSDLVLGDSPSVQISGVNASDFTVGVQPPSPVSPNSSVSMTIEFNPSSTGLRSATVSIGNSDLDENPYTFALQGTGTTSPEISISGNGLTISNGDNSPSMNDSTYLGNVDASLGVGYATFTIHNSGSSILTLNGVAPVAITGANASDFSLSSIEATSVPAGSSVDFVIAFDPSAVGLRNAALSITSNDPDNTPYLFAIQGNGTGPGSPLACVPNFFQIYGTNGTIAYLDATTNPYTYTTIATAGYQVNAFGYNLEDGLLYGIEQGSTLAGDNLIRIDATGAITVLASINIPFQSYNADFNGSGDFYFFNTQGDQLAVLDVSDGSMTTLTPSGPAFPPGDIAYLDADGRFYGVNQSTLYIYDPITNTISTAALTGKLAEDFAAGTNGQYYGAAWSASDGYIYTANNDSGRMYKVNISTHETIYVGQAVTTTQGDAASCPLAEAPLPSTGTVGDRVWLDADGDGVQDASEVGMAGITVSLYDADDTFLASVVSDESGAYLFQNLSPSEYYLSFTTPPVGFGLTGMDLGGDDNLDSDADPATGRTANFTISAGMIESSLDAGFKGTGVGDFVWLDVNENGVQDAGELGVPGISVEIKIESSGASAGTAVTDAQGYYRFTGLSPQAYRLFFTNLPAGYVFSPQDQGGDDALDSDVNTSSGQTASFTPSNGVFNSSFDAGVYQQSEPEINIVANGQTIQDGDDTPAAADFTDFGSINASLNATSATDSVVHTFTIQNVSGADLTLNGTPLVGISGAHAADFHVRQEPAGSIVAGNSTDFTISFIPTAEGLRSAVVSIANTDADENPYNFNIRGFGLASEIQVEANGIVISDGATTPSLDNLTDFGTQDISTGTDAHIFTIFNSGNANLVLRDPSPHLTLGGDHPEDFSITAAPISPVASNGTTTFTLTFDPVAVGLRTAIVSIASNDLDEDPYDFVIQGTGSATPEIDILGKGASIASGDMSPTTDDNTDFGSKDILTGTQINSFAIVNPGSGDLTLSGTPLVLISGAHAGDFSVNQQPSQNSVAALTDTIVFQITFNPTSVGLRSASVNIVSDDADENPFTFAIQGTGIASSDIDVLGNSLSIANGDMTPSVLDSTLFDSTVFETSSSITFTLRNNGSAALNLTDPSPYINITGDHAADFQLTTAPQALLTAGGGTSLFTITFTPSAEGDRQALVSIASDDPDSNPFTFAIGGFGLPTPQPELTLSESVNLAVAAPGDTLTYTVVYSNVGEGLATSVVIDQDIPDNARYVEDSALGENMIIVYSHDGGSTFNSLQTAPVTQIRYQRVAALPPGGNGLISFRVVVE